jgi:iron complex transport system ATP-binding protein
MEDFSLEIGSGTITAILGPNGAGKTTLLHLALGWLRPQNGEIILNQRSLRSYSRRELGQRMGLVPQSEYVAYEYSLLEFVLLGRAPHLPTLAMPGRDDFQIAISALRQVGLGDSYQRSITQMSGGERQLTLVARALAQEPHILLLDEPTSHLDLYNKNRLLNIIKQLNDQGVTILLTTHEPEVASTVATQVVLMNGGRVLQTGPVNQVFTSVNLSATYGFEVEVLQLGERRIVLWM